MGMQNAGQSGLGMLKVDSFIDTSLYNSRLRFVKVLNNSNKYEWRQNGTNQFLNVLKKKLLI